MPENELNAEEKEQLQQKIVDAGKLKALIEHTGWSDVLLPRLLKLREGLIGRFLIEKLDLTGFLLIQQSVNAIDSIIGGINLAITQGEDAVEKLKE